MNDCPPFEPSRLSAHAAQNRTSWNADSDTYQRDHGPQLSSSSGPAWGVWQIPEAELQVLGDVRGRDVLELGCGAAQWSIKLAQAGARPVGVDISENQLEHARRLMAEADVDFPLVHASAESVPLPGRSFDIVMCSYGAMTFADPYATVPEVARLLRPGGLFAFCGSTPIIEMCYPEEGDHPGDKLNTDYFGMWCLPWEGYVEYMLPYGAWIRLFRAHGFVIEDLIELRPKPDAVSTFRDDVDREWYRRWPGEQIWKLTKEL
ncbi:MAG: class I SAM-dependent methyltransferase [Actinobacteria bacterium]|nr:class I SAM-dependent methyltransferase [Actinomycetota bacterium]